MPQIIRRTRNRSYDLFSSFIYYAPGIGGMLMLGLMFLIGTFLGNIFTLILALCSNAETASSYGIVVSYPLMFIPAMLYASYQSRKNQLFETGYSIDSSNFGKMRGWAVALIVSVATLACNLASDVFQLLLPPMTERWKTALESLMDAPLWVTVLSTVIFAPIFEEWLCRGMILRGLLQKTRPVWAMVVSALFFALIHANPWQAIPAFLLGMLFAYVYYRTGSLKLTMLMHAVNNGFAVLISRCTGMEMDASLYDMLETWQYASIVAAGIFIVVVAVDIIRRNIPLKSRSGSCDVILND